MFAAVALVGGLALGSGFAAVPQEPAGKTRIALDVVRVDILLTVTDKRGRFITNLTRDDFEVMEDARPQRILGFAAQTDLPLRIAVLLDTSSSIRDRFRFIQEAAIEFITAVVRPRLDKVTVLSFDSTVEQVSPLDGDLGRFATAIRGLHPGRGTSLYDAIRFACRDGLDTDKPGHDMRRVIVVLSDGEDTQSQGTRDQALEAAQKASVVIHAVSTNTARTDTHGDKVLKYFAQETGGVAFFPFRIEDLAKSFETLATEMRRQYRIFYRPEPLLADGRYHAITLRVKGRKDVVIRARKGYYAPRP
ncbi:MAG: VWA domain-containing protein [Bryobacterales bacterium]|nr:VWA domain-containing protein [Bryobacterales bacterium]